MRETKKNETDYFLPPRNSGIRILIVPYGYIIWWPNVYSCSTEMLSVTKGDTQVLRGSDAYPQLC